MRMRMRGRQTLAGESLLLQSPLPLAPSRRIRPPVPSRPSSLRRAARKASTARDEHTLLWLAVGFLGGLTAGLPSVEGEGVWVWGPPEWEPVLCPSLLRVFIGGRQDVTPDTLLYNCFYSLYCIHCV